MKAFFIGLLFLMCIGILYLVVILLLPFLAALNFILYILAFLAVITFLVWLLGKFLIWAWSEIKK